jgi:hypothetical protein
MAAVALAVGLLGAPAATAKNEKVYGVEMPSWSKKVGEDRFQSPRNWEKTVKFFSDQFKGWKSIKWHREINLPSVKYVHIENTNKKGDWSGINLYELPNGKVRIYVLKRLEDAKPLAADAKETKKKS